MPDREQAGADGERRDRRIGPNDIIICKGVKKWFGDFQALHGITTSVKEREVVVIFGPSGSGKSTFIRTLNRLEAHDAGRIVIDGIELNDDLETRHVLETLLHHRRNPNVRSFRKNKKRRTRLV